MMMGFLRALEESALSTWLLESPSIWAYPLVLTLHTVGLAALVGINTAFHLRVLGCARDIPLARLEALFPAMWAGFWLNLITGAMLFASVATTKGTAPVFMIKVGLVSMGVIAAIVSRRAVYRTSGVPVVTRAARRWAIVSLVIWTAAIATGRLMAYL